MDKIELLQVLISLYYGTKQGFLTHEDSSWYAITPFLVFVGVK